ncbi:MAG: hypothetical protein COV75_07060 [Candidatus Omnitrophica bacterium CG11_big_fil_rev_8_21_14_0_20_63_9]|nr:MAG: hypothetical protein COV75_07060 [Candidatus Omnitrophica bacterium CG11_big_fil_rev_8_21_14_0_20_63_9]
MKSSVVMLALSLSLIGGLSASAEEAAPVAAAPAEVGQGVKALPTLVISGEVVSVDTGDPAAQQLKVKDRYGFETLIYLASNTALTQGGSTIPATSLTPGSPVEVEYNFDINTAKRHAVSVKLSVPEAAPSTASTPTPEAVPAPAPASEEAPAPAPAPEATETPAEQPQQ